MALGESNKQGIDLSHMADYSNLERLVVSGHTRGIATLNTVVSLKKLSLRRIGKQTRLDFLSRLAGLQHLSLSLGGRSSIAEIDIPGLKELEVCRVRGLTDLGGLSRFQALETLVVDEQAQLATVFLWAANSELRRLGISQCKALRGVSSLDTLPKLVLGETALD